MFTQAIEEKQTAEQKLLKIIEESENTEGGGSSSVPADDVAQQIANSVKGTGVTFSLPPFVANLLALVKGGASLDKPNVAFGLKEVNRILTIGIVIIFAYALINFLKGMTYSQKEFVWEVESTIAGKAELMVPQFKGVREYLEIVSFRNIFQPWEEKVLVDEEIAVVKQIKLIEEKTQDLKLVGVSWLDTPESASALIENTSSGITYFLKKGEKVNNVVVKAIYADTVILA